MMGLEKIYDDLDGCRKRLVRIEDMDRIPKPEALKLMAKILTLMDDVNDAIERGVEVDYSLEAMGDK